MGALRLVGIGAGPVAGAAAGIARPHIAAPAADAHKYRRGLLGVVGGDMPGAAILAATAAQGAGAGYVKLLGWRGMLRRTFASAADLVTDVDDRWPRRSRTAGSPPSSSGRVWAGTATASSGWW